MPASTLSLYNSANVPPSHQNLISNKNFGLYLSTDTKNSPLSSVLLPQSVAKSRTSPLKKFQAQKSWNSKFWPTDVLYTSKESWEHVQFRFSKKKYIFLQKKNFFSIFSIFASWSRLVKNFRRQVFRSFQNKFKIWLYHGLAKVERNKVRKLQQFWSISLRATRDQLLVRAQSAPPHVE